MGGSLDWLGKMISQTTSSKRNATPIAPNKDPHDLIPAKWQWAKNVPIVEQKDTMYMDYKTPILAMYEDGDESGYHIRASKGIDHDTLVHEIGHVAWKKDLNKIDRYSWSQLHSGYPNSRGSSIYPDDQEQSFAEELSTFLKDKKQYKANNPKALYDYFVRITEENSKVK